MDEASAVEPDSLESARELCEHRIARYHDTRDGVFAWTAIGEFLKSHPGHPLPQGAIDYLQGAAKAVIEHAGNPAALIEHLGLQKKAAVPKGTSHLLPYQLRRLQYMQLYGVAKNHRFSDAEAYRWIAKNTGDSFDAIEQLIRREML